MCSSRQHITHDYITTNFRTTPFNAYQEKLLQEKGRKGEKNDNLLVFVLYKRTNVLVSNWEMRVDSQDVMDETEEDEDIDSRCFAVCAF
jgi:hypothetical protein